MCRSLVRIVGGGLQGGCEASFFFYIRYYTTENLFYLPHIACPCRSLHISHTSRFADVLSVRFVVVVFFSGHYRTLPFAHPSFSLLVFFLLSLAVYLPIHYTLRILANGPFTGFLGYRAALHACTILWCNAMLA